MSLIATRAPLGSLVLAACLLDVHAAGAAESRKACAQAANKGQELRDAGKLLEAREQFVACARDACPSIVSKQCTTWLQNVDRDTPTVTFRAKDGTGKEVVDVHVSIDDVSRADSLDGRAMPLDPGPHRLLFERAGQVMEQDVTIRVGEKDRIIDVVFPSPVPATPRPAAPAEPPPAPAAAEPAPSRGFHIPLVSVIAGGVGLASFGAMTVFAISASNEEKSLRSSCAPGCSQSSVDSVHTKLLLANVSLGVGVASLAVMTVALVLGNTGGSRAPSATATRIGLAPTPGGAMGGVSGSF